MPRDRTYRTEAIVLSRTDFGEADRLLTLFSREYGKVRAIAKGARKPQSRKTGHVELFMRTRFLIAEGRNLDIVTQAEMVEAYAQLRDDLVRTTYASYIVELLDRFTVEEDRNSQLYDLLSEALRRFATTDNLLLAAR
ncbi:MAG: DNA repair protein RecO, partial [Chloroflexota bacterium]